MTTPSYYTTDDRGRAWLEVWIGDTAYGEIYRAVREGPNANTLDTAMVSGKRREVLTPMQSPHVQVAGVLELPRDLNTQGYG